MNKQPPEIKFPVVYNSPYSGSGCVFCKSPLSGRDDYWIMLGAMVGTKETQSSADGEDMFAFWNIHHHFHAADEDSNTPELLIDDEFEDVDQDSEYDEDKHYQQNMIGKGWAEIVHNGGGGQADIGFCSSKCLRSFFNHMVDKIEGQ